MAKSNNQPNKIEDIKRHLYDRDVNPISHHREGVLHQENHADIPKEWNTNDISNINMTTKKTTKVFKNFFIGAFVFLIIAIAIAAFVFLKGNATVSSDNIQVLVLGNSFVKGGEELPLQIEVINNNSAGLESVNMTIEYPKGATGTSSDVSRLPRESLGDIAAGGRIEKNIKLILFGDQNTVQEIKIILEYRSVGSGQIISKETIYPVTISSSPISISLFAPEETSSNQLINLKIVATLNTTLPSDDIVLKVDYPSGFKFEGSTPKTSFGDSIWSLADLKQEEPLTIDLSGRIIGQDNDEQVFHFYIGTVKSVNQSVIDVVYNSLLHSIVIKKPFLETKLIINGESSDQFAIYNNSNIKASIVWSNNLPVRLTDTQITANFSGNVFDRNSVDAEAGFYDSSNDSIIWDRNTTNDLISVVPSGTCEKSKILLTNKL